MFVREYGELAGAGGVKDVAAQLSRALARWNGRRVCVVLPLYGFMDPDKIGCEPLPDPLFPEKQLSFDVEMNYSGRERDERVRVWHATMNRVKLYFIEAERYQEKQNVYTYTREEFQRESWKTPGAGHFDFFAMNILLQKAGLDLIMILDEKPEILHCHDGHTAVAPAIINECDGYRHYFRVTSSVVTIHNAGIGYHQEVSDLAFVQAVTGLPLRVVNESCLDHSFDPLIAAGSYATISTVSENYAREMQETDDDYLTGWLGHRLKNKGVRITGITNGIDPQEFNPKDAEAMGIAAGFDLRDKTDDLAGKQICKKMLLNSLASEPAYDDPFQAGYLAGDPSWPLYAFIGRLSDQKGIDILTEALELFLADGTKAQIVCLGSGGEKEEEALKKTALKKNIRGRVCFLRGFDSGLANRVYAAGDFLVIPSRYEPCGLTDFIAQLFGTLPIVHHVGGLVKVIDGQTGLAYSDNSPENLADTMDRALKLFDDAQQIRKMQYKAVSLIDNTYTWDQVMKNYVNLYKKSRQNR